MTEIKFQKNLLHSFTLSNFGGFHLQCHSLAVGGGGAFDFILSSENVTTVNLY